ncbi:hypothetical protein [Psychrobacillus sp. L3]|uniref:hypothetical protein n=1 Tax=Psychrobacillus sp. L3 TaxID=3236891 RepID=UPI0036F1CFE0
MEENNKGILYLHMFIGTLGLIIIAVGLLKYYETVGGTGSSFALIGFPLTMIYMNYLEGKAGISKKILWIQSIIAIFSLFIIYIYFN